ncbi:MAG: hypothetical protein ACRCWJ_20705 [Casimicrobium sp.]
MSAALTNAQAAIEWVPPRPFSDVLAFCVAQVTKGKGAERHGGRAPFITQPWVALADAHTVGFLTGQSEKKWHEAHGSVIARDDVRYLCEVAGAINYSLFALILLCDREVAAKRVSPHRVGLSADAWLAGVWPTVDVVEAHLRLVQPPEKPAPAFQDRAVLVRLIQFQVLKMAKAAHERMQRMVPPLNVLPLRFPAPEPPARKSEAYWLSRPFASPSGDTLDVPTLKDQVK